MMNKRGSVVTLLAFTATLMSSVLADGTTAEQTPNPQQQYAIARMQDVQNRPFFSPSLNLPEHVRTFGCAQAKVGFVKATAKDVYVCSFDYVANKVSVTKYEKVKNAENTKRAINQSPIAVQNGLYAVKTESYDYAFSGSTHCTRKGVGARTKLPVGERIARVLQATTNPADMNPLNVSDLYEACIPTWIQADSAQDVIELQQWLMDDLIVKGINPGTAENIAKPIAVFTLKDDIILESFGTDLNAGLWESTRGLFNVTTFRSTELRKLFWDTHKDLVDARKAAKDQGIDINPSLIEGLFADLEKESEFFAVNNMIRRVFRGLYEKFEKYGIPALAIYLAWEFALKPVKRWACGDAEKEKAKHERKRSERREDMERAFEAGYRAAQKPAPVA